MSAAGLRSEKRRERAENGARAAYGVMWAKSLYQQRTQRSSDACQLPPLIY